MKEAWKKVKANKGSAGMDAMTISGAASYRKEHWAGLREKISALMTEDYLEKRAQRASKKK